MQAAFMPSAQFQGAQPGYAFRNGANGVGYYRDGAQMPQQRAPRAQPHANFLAALEQVEARDAPVANYRRQAQQPQYPPQRHVAAYRGHPEPLDHRPTQPGWARMETTSTSAYQRPDPTMQRVGNSRQRRGHFEALQSQIDFSQPDAPSRFERRELPRSCARGGNAYDRPAGGRSNLAGPSNGHGVMASRAGHAQGVLG